MPPSYSPRDIIPSTTGAADTGDTFKPTRIPTESKINNKLVTNFFIFVLSPFEVCVNIKRGTTSYKPSGTKFYPQISNITYVGGILFVC